MKILMLTPYVPYPPNSGGQIRTYNLIKNLSRKHEITSFSFLRTDHTEPDLSELRKYCHKVETFRRNKSFSSILKILKTGFSAYPYLVNMYLSADVQRAIKKELEEGNYDLIHVETYYIMANLPKTTVPVLLAEQTIEYLVYQHYAETSPWWQLWPPWSIKLFLYIDSAKHKFWEQYFWRKAQKVVAMSEDDKAKMLELVPNLGVDVVPNGVDIDFFTKKLKLPSRSHPRLLFVGNFNWLQNREAAMILIKRIWPLIENKLSKAQLWIVGREPTAEIKALAGPNIVISGNVEDIREAYQGSDLLIAPIFGGGGTRYKILEAMASGLPVVTTEIGIAGLGVVNNVHALITDNEARLAECVIEIVNGPQKAQQIARNAKKLVFDNFEWHEISNKLEKIYEETAKKT